MSCRFKKKITPDRAVPDPTGPSGMSPVVPLHTINLIMQKFQTNPPFVTTPTQQTNTCSQFLSTWSHHSLVPLLLIPSLHLHLHLHLDQTPTTIKSPICFLSLLKFNHQMDLVNSVLNFVVPPASLVMLAFAWPALCFVNTCEKIYNTYFNENFYNMEGKVVIITGASSGIGEVN